MVVVVKTVVMVMVVAVKRNSGIQQASITLIRGALALTSHHSLSDVECILSGPSCHLIDSIQR